MTVQQCPVSLKAVAHYLKIAEEHDTRDVIISYWSRLYALEVAMQISVNNKTPEVNKFLLSIMDWLESTKSENANNECITNKVCAQSYLENYSLKLFSYADGQDQTESYGKNVVKAFYTAGILMDVLSSFGDLDEEIAEKRKYAKWKAAYIHNCLKQGERPTPGSYGQQREDGFTKISDMNEEDNTDPDALIPGLPSVPTDINPTPMPPGPINPNIPPMFPNLPSVPNMPQVPNIPQMPAPTQPVYPVEPAYVPPIQPVISNPVISNNDVSLNPEQISKAQKYCKWASSALNYDDAKTAIVNLQKALTLLQTGRDSPE